MTEYGKNKQKRHANDERLKVLQKQARNRLILVVMYPLSEKLERAQGKK